MAVVYPRFNQTSAGESDNLAGLLCVQRRLRFKSGWNKTVVFAAVVGPKVLAHIVRQYLPNGSSSSQVVFSVVQVNVT